MRIVRNVMQVCEELQGLLRGRDRVAELAQEMASNGNIRADMIRARLSVHGIPKDKAEEFIAVYEAAKRAQPTA